MHILRRRPQLSVVVIVYNMAREAPRTLLSLSASYQQDVQEENYEVIVVDNGSDPPLSKATAEKYGNNFRYFYIEDSSSSPVPALNFGIERARGKHLGIMIDGARICTPGMLKNALKGLSMSKRAVVTTFAFHLGPTPQYLSIAEGYDQSVEDKLLAEINWSKNGYDLFKISSFAGSCKDDYFNTMVESNAVFMPRSLIKELEGFDHGFDMPGGGLVNLDFVNRINDLKERELILLLGEGTFHQFHNGVATNRGIDNYWNLATKNYAEVRGKKYSASKLKDYIFLGHFPPQMMPSLRLSLEKYESRIAAEYEE